MERYHEVREIGCVALDGKRNRSLQRRALGVAAERVAGGAESSAGGPTRGPRGTQGRPADAGRQSGEAATSVRCGLRRSAGAAATGHRAAARRQSRRLQPAAPAAHGGTVQQHRGGCRRAAVAPSCETLMRAAWRRQGPSGGMGRRGTTPRGTMTAGGRCMPQRSASDLRAVAASTEGPPVVFGRVSTPPWTSVSAVPAPFAANRWLRCMPACGTTLSLCLHSMP